MNVITTKAPIGIEDLKIYFQDKDTRYIIDYGISDIKGEKLLVYLGNLDLPCDILYDTDASLFEMVEAYLKFTHIVNIPSLEYRVIDMLLQRKGLKENFTPAAVEKYGHLLDAWIEKLDSLVLFNMYCINDDSIKEQIVSLPTDDTDSTEGINFVSLLKHEEFYSFYQDTKEEHIKYYSKYFNEYMFKGQNLYSYWANENNPMFLLTWGIANGIVTKEQYDASVATSLLEIQKEIQELENVPPVQ
jgi:hypothetical protein